MSTLPSEKNELPPYDRRVLVWYNGAWEIGIRVATNGKGHRWQLRDCRGFKQEPFNLEHWQELPVPPKGLKKGNKR